MTISSYLHLLVEGDLDEYVLRQVLKPFDHLQIVTCLGKKGRTYIERNIQQYNRAAASPAFNCFCVVDLDRDTCPPGLIQRLLPETRHPDLVLRIAVREVEAWLMADAVSLSRFLGVSRSKMPYPPDACPQPKAAIIQAARGSRRREVLRDIVPPEGSSAKEGRNYTARMIEFVLHNWNIAEAEQHSLSLRRALHAFRSFTPHVR